MKKMLIIAAIVVVAFILIGGGILAYTKHKIDNIEDTHDLQAQVKKKCEAYIKEGKGVGLFVGIIQGDKIYSQGFGLTDKEHGALPDSNTIFEIGSLSKVFTVEIAQFLVAENQLSWGDNIMMYLPEEAKPSTDDSTTLMNLATHTSGLPRLPESWFPKMMTDECNPYSMLSITDLYSTIQKTENKKQPSLNNYNYSNLGMGLLGHILQWKTGKDYETLLQQYICGHLAMPHTATVMQDTGKMATPYDAEGKRACYWTFPILAGAGGIKSDGADMLRFLKANMYTNSETGKIFAATQQPVVKIPGGKIAHGWHIDMLSGMMSGVDSIVWHNGGTGGFRSYMGFIPERQVGIIVLSNKADGDFDELAIKILCKAGTTSLKE